MTVCEILRDILQRLERMSDALSDLTTEQAAARAKGANR